MIFSLFLLLAAPTGAVTNGFEQQAQAAWDHREEPGQTEQAIELWKLAVQKNPRDTDLYIRITRACGRAVRHAANNKERNRWADEGRKFGALAVEKNPRNADAYAEYGAALGQWARAHKGFSSLSVVRQSVKTLKDGLAIDPHNAQAHMILAEIYRHSPSLISGGSKKEALEHAEEAARFGPGYAINHLILAKAYIDVGKREAGINELQKILTLTPPPDAIPETNADQETAAAMLKSMGIMPTIASHCGDATGVCTEQHP